MKNLSAFQIQLASIMEALSKAAVTEISKLVEEGSVVLRLEVSRSQKEIGCLRKKLQQAESELRTTQEAATRESRSVGVQAANQFEAADGAVKGGKDAAFAEHLKEKKCKAQTRDARPDFGFSVKEELEQEHVAQVLRQTESEPNAGRLNNVGSKDVIFERESQLWSSFIHRDRDYPVCSNTTEQCSQSQLVLLPIQQTPATMEIPGSTLSSLEKDGHVVDGGVLKEEARGQCLYTEESRSEMGDTQQMEHKQPLLSTNDDLTSQVIHPVQQQLDLQIGVTEDSMDPVSSSNQNARISWRPDAREKPYSCALCQKRFDRYFHLERHQRVHTGEKPFSCAQCGKRFSLKFNLITHERVHTGNKPFGCVHCGKRFAQGSNLRVHNRIHTGERPYHCTQCGKSFNQLSSLKTHWKTHSRNEILEFGINCT